MPILRLELDPETYDRLIEQAVTERRPIVWQAEIALRRAVGLTFPSDAETVDFSRGVGADHAPGA